MKICRPLACPIIIIILLHTKIRRSHSKQLCPLGGSRCCLPLLPSRSFASSACLSANFPLPVHLDIHEAPSAVIQPLRNCLGTTDLNVLDRTSQILFIKRNILNSKTLERKILCGKDVRRRNDQVVQGIVS